LITDIDPGMALTPFTSSIGWNEIQTYDLFIVIRVCYPIDWTFTMDARKLNLCHAEELRCFKICVQTSSNSLASKAYVVSAIFSCAFYLDLKFKKTLDCPGLGADSDFCCLVWVFVTCRRKIIDNKTTELSSKKWKNSFVMKEKKVL
jgi:hypothetical protein